MVPDRGGIIIVLGMEEACPYELALCHISSVLNDLCKGQRVILRTSRRDLRQRGSSSLRQLEFVKCHCILHVCVVSMFIPQAVNPLLEAMHSKKYRSTVRLL